MSHCWLLLWMGVPASPTASGSDGCHTAQGGPLTQHQTLSPSRCSNGVKALLRVEVVTLLGSLSFSGHLGTSGKKTRK
jgi:hypothetical protein